MSESIKIEWYVVTNVNTRRGGFMPVYSVNGVQRGDTYGFGWDRDVALRLAKLSAEEEASRYVGDWQVTCEARKER